MAAAASGAAPQALSHSGSPHVGGAGIIAEGEVDVWYSRRAARSVHVVAIDIYW
jgi:hypothetical protein